MLVLGGVDTSFKFLTAAIEASSPQKDPKCMLFPSFTSSSEGWTNNAAAFLFNWEVGLYL